MAANTVIQVDGLGDLVRAFRKLESDLPGQVKGELKEAAGIVAREAKAQAAQQGLRRTGALIAAIRPSVRRGTIAAVTDNVKSKTSGFLYGRIYEYARGRAYLEPAVDAKRTEVERRIDVMLGRMGHDVGF